MNLDVLGADGVAALLCLLFIVADYGTGILQAVKNKMVNSTKLREGLWHKLGFIGAMALGYGCQICCNYGILPDSFSAIFAGVCVYVIITELVSIFENLCEFSPELKESPLAQLLHINEGGSNDA